MLNRSDRGTKFLMSAEIYLARNAGFHFLFLDLDHSSLSFQAANNPCAAALYVLSVFLNRATLALSSGGQIIVTRGLGDIPPRRHRRYYTAPSTSSVSAA